MGYMNAFLNEDKKRMDISLKYNLHMGTKKMEAYILFELGYKAKQVIYALKHLDLNQGTGAFERTIRQYYRDWKKAQKR